jgi:hypothetical protein
VHAHERGARGGGDVCEQQPVGRDRRLGDALGAPQQRSGRVGRQRGDGELERHGCANGERQRSGGRNLTVGPDGRRGDHGGPVDLQFDNGARWCLHVQDVIVGDRRVEHGAEHLVVVERRGLLECGKVVEHGLRRVTGRVQHRGVGGQGRDDRLVGAQHRREHAAQGDRLQPGLELGEYTGAHRGRLGRRIGDADRGVEHRGEFGVLGREDVAVGERNGAQRRGGRLERGDVGGEVGRRRDLHYIGQRQSVGGRVERAEHGRRDDAWVCQALLEGVYPQTRRDRDERRRKRLLDGREVDVVRGAPAEQPEEVADHFGVVHERHRRLGGG